MPSVIKQLRSVGEEIKRILSSRSREFRLLIFHRVEGTRGRLCFRHSRRLRTPPTALLLNFVPEFAAVFRLDRTVMMRERRKCRLQHFLVTLPRQNFTYMSAQAMAQVKQHVGQRTRIVKRSHRRRRNADYRLRCSRLRNVIDPRFEKRVVGKNQICQSARLVEKAAETGDERDFLQCLFDAPSEGSSENWIRFVE